MSTERIKQLHEHASERHFSGDYLGALQAWQEVLSLDPADEQALGGVRLASQFIEPDEAVELVTSQSVSSVEHELDRGLRVLDGLGATMNFPSDPEDGEVDRKPEAESVETWEKDELLLGWDPPASAPADEGSFGIEALPGSTPAAAPRPSAAAAELGRRVKDLLCEAKHKASVGERDEALAILARLAILDEDNAEAASLRSQIEAQGNCDLDKVESAIIEGVSALEADRLDDAERFFNQALALVPKHREALHYLEKVAERRAGGAEDLLELVSSESAPPENAVHRAVAMEEAPRPRAPKPAKSVEPQAAASPSDPPPKAPRMTLPPPKFLILAGVGVVVLACAWFAVSRFAGEAPQETVVQKPIVPQSRTKRPTKSSPATNGGNISSARALPKSPEEAAKMLAADVAKGRALMASGDFGGAVIAFNDALSLDPQHAAARTGLEDAAERYTATKAEREALNSIKLAFRDGEYTSGLRLAYRLPPSVSRAYADSVKVAGWYNLAVVALRAGECREAASHLDEALQVVPTDAESTSLRELATRYLDAVKDRTFLDRVEALSFRPLPSS